MEFYSQNDGFAGAEKRIGEFHPSFSSPFLKPISGAMAQLFKPVEISTLCFLTEFEKMSRNRLVILCEKGFFRFCR